jgi:uncharacterized protein
VVSVQAEVLLAGPGTEASALALTAPISFWGGVNPKSGEIADPRHPEHGRCISGTVLLVPETVGSSSAAAILLLGLIVAKEMGLPTPIALRLDRRRFGDLHDRRVKVSEDGVVSYVPPS